MQTNQSTLPNWLLIVSGLFALLELLVSIALFVTPESMMETVEFSATGVDELKNMWAIRQLALGVIFGWATIKKSVPMLTSAYLFLFIVFIGDLTLGLAKQEIPLIITALLMSLIAGGLLVLLKKYK